MSKCQSFGKRIFFKFQPKILAKKCMKRLFNYLSTLCIIGLAYGISPAQSDSRLQAPSSVYAFIVFVLELLAI